MDALTLAAIPAAAAGFRSSVRAFLKDAATEWTPERRARSWMGFDADFSRKLASRGWIGLTLPIEFGGQGRTAFDRYVLLEELLAAGAPVSAHWIADRQHAPLILKHGSESQKRFYLPRICRAEAFFCIGMSEPQAGSDLASVKSRATRSPNGWRLRGHKLWTTNAAQSHYMVALVRTSGASEDRHKGLSQFIIDLSLPGITIRPIKDLTGDSHFSEVFFDDVELADDALVGSEGAGWQQVTAELAFERSGPERLYSNIVLLDTWLAWLRATGPTDSASATLAGRIATHLAVLRAMSIAVTEKLTRDESPAIEAALVKDLGTALEQFIAQAITDALGANPQSAIAGSLRRTLAYATQICPSYSLRGGTREVLRGVIARGLGLR